jgi:hypothetical protein
VVAVAVDDLPLAALSVVDVGGAQGGAHEGSVLREGFVVLVGDGVREVAAGAGGDELQVVGVAGGESRGEPSKDRLYLVPARPGRGGGAEQGDRVEGRPHGQSACHVAAVQSELGVDEPRHGRLEEVLDGGHDCPRSDATAR